MLSRCSKKKDIKSKISNQKAEGSKSFFSKVPKNNFSIPMNSSALFISYMTIVRKEVTRFLRVWKQTIVPPVITTTLYYVIFGQFIGSRIGTVGGMDYMQFIVPGLVMMSLIMNSFSHVVGSFYMAKFQKTIEEILVSPTPYWIVIFGFITG